MSRLWAVDRHCLSQCAHYFLFDCTYTGQLIPDSLSVDGSYYFFDCTCTVSVGILLYNPTLAHFRIQGTRSSSERPERTRLDSGGGVESLLVPCGRFVLISLVGPLLPCRVRVTRRRQQDQPGKCGPKVTVLGPPAGSHNFEACQPRGVE